MMEGKCSILNRQVNGCLNVGESFEEELASLETLEMNYQKVGKPKRRATIDALMQTNSQPIHL